MDEPSGPGASWVAGTADQLLDTEFPPMRFLVEGLIIEAGLIILGGKKKLGKSWFALQLARCVAEGTDFLGLSTSEGAVLYVCLEDGCRRLQARMKKQDFPRGLPVEIRTEFRCLDDGGLEDLRNLLEQDPKQLVIIDTLAASMSGRSDENSSRDMGPLMNKLRRIAQACDSAILLVHHHGKAESSGNAGDDLRGSSAMGAAADCYLGLYKRSNGFELEAEGRDIEELSKSISRDRECCLWTVSMDAKERTIHSLAVRIHTALQQEDLSRTELRRRFAKQGDAHPLDDALELLEKDGKATRSEEGTTGRPREKWSGH